MQAQYEKRRFSVQFLDYYNNVAGTQSVWYGEAAIPPGEDKLRIPAGFKFLQWQTDAYLNVKENLTVKPAIVYASPDRPIVTTISSITKNEDGYSVGLSLKNNGGTEKVAALLFHSSPPPAGKLLATTESAAFSIAAEGTRVWEEFLPYEGAAHALEVLVIKSYKVNVPISDACNITVNPKQFTISVTSNNTSYGTVSGGEVYTDGTTVTLRAVAKASYRFVC